MNKNRIEAFSDGVIAIIITIMVLEIKIPHEASEQALQTVAPKLVSYLLSFVFVGIYWANHHHLLHVVKKVSAGIIWANLNLLFWLSMVPVATAWMGETHFSNVPVACYAVLLAMCGVSFTILQKVIAKHTHENHAMMKALQKQDRKGIISTASYIAAIPLAFWQPAVSGALFVFVSILWLVPDKNIEKALND